MRLYPSEIAKGESSIGETQSLSSTQSNRPEAWRELSDSEFFRRLSSEGKIVGTREADLTRACLEELSHRWVRLSSTTGSLSYPILTSGRSACCAPRPCYSSSLLAAALEEGMILKDASAYNVQWQGARPVFIDVASFETWAEGDPWAGYLQLC